MAKRKQIHRHDPKNNTTTTRHLPIVQADAAGIDVGSAEHFVAVPADRDPSPVRRFAADLNRLAHVGWTR